VPAAVDWRTNTCTEASEDGAPVVPMRNATMRERRVAEPVRMSGLVVAAGAREPEAPKVGMVDLL
jgi:hypothetical protein